jgi:hypothetical protein
MCKNLDRIIRSQKSEQRDRNFDYFEMELERIGSPKSAFIILESQQMTPEMWQKEVDDYHLIIRVKAPSNRYPSRQRVTAIPSIPDRFIPNDVFVMWSYEKRAEVDGDTIIAGTREFCRTLIKKNWLYTREEIEQLNNNPLVTATGLSVWESGGGFWNDNGTIKAHCRHTWVQNLVKKK